MNKLLTVLNGVILLVLIGLLHKINILDNTLSELKVDIAFQQKSESSQRDTSNSPSQSPTFSSFDNDTNNNLSLDTLRLMVRSELKQWAESNNQFASSNSNQQSDQIRYDDLSETGKQKRDNANVIINTVLAQQQVSPTDLEQVYSALRHLPTEEKKLVLRKIAQRTNSGSLKVTD
ncbi:MAG: hypothetical protein HWE27_13745 [Gammaproteobacteria bacterium]|nr:hypothetical protein [Gammaproteobacteria bacterium]